MISFVCLLESVRKTIPDAPAYLVLACASQIMRKWNYRAREHTNARGHAPAQYVKAMPIDQAGAFMPLWVTWALKEIRNEERRLREHHRQREEEAEQALVQRLVELNFNDTDLDAVANEPELMDEL